MTRERRKHTRWKLDESVHCYIDGDRIDHRSFDVSSGGLFLITDNPIPPGVQVALVFQSQFQETGIPIFLVARVMRRQLQPVAGVGLRWERAVTEAPAEQLIAFLRTHLRLLAPRVETGPMSRRPGGEQAYYVYTHETASVLPPAVQPVTPAAGKLSRRSGTVTGPLTDKIRTVGVLVAAKIDGTVEAGGKKEPCRIEGLGGNVMTIAADLRGPGKGRELKVTFSIKGKQGLSPVTCHCTVIRSELRRRGLITRMDLEIVRCDEAEKGIYQHYVRWLHFNALRSI
ncbi:MAG: PilZ domain-containing protein [Deltaproteobacteria bacterium]|nr:PilZ domain-containing protein [Deltaproteobacteria bacterium]